MSVITSLTTMLTLLIVSAFIALAGGLPQRESKGSAKNSARSIHVGQVANAEFGIINGTKVKNNPCPSTAAIFISGSYMCSGSIINNFYVATLSSCIDGANVSSVAVHIGCNDVSSHSCGKKYEAKKIIQHPQYSSWTLDYDIALIKCAPKIKFSKKVKPAKLPNKNTASGQKCVTCSYGTKSRGVVGPLTMAHVTTVDQQKCIDKFPWDDITPRMFCCTQNNGALCYGDFGSPIYCNGVVYGLFSWTRGCTSSTNYYSVENNFYSVKEWIKNNSKLHNYDDETEDNDSTVRKRRWRRSEEEEEYEDEEGGEKEEEEQEEQEDQEDQEEQEEQEEDGEEEEHTGEEEDSGEEVEEEEGADDGH